MDAVAFVMGERTANLRVRHLSDLICGGHIDRPVSGPSRVTASFMLEDGSEKRFMRLIRGSSSEYSIQDQVGFDKCNLYYCAV